MTIVKICGLRTVEHALAAVAAGADMLGFILAPSRRQISPSELATISAAVRTAPGGERIGLVGVFVNESLARMLEIARACHLDTLQLSGDEDSRILADLPPSFSLIKALRLNDAAAERPWQQALSVRLLVDAHVPGMYGGAGVVADWQRAAELAAHREILLAGGLSPDNVAAAIETVQPWGVDVSSGVETDGVKDVGKIRAFVAAARAVGRQVDVARL
jgi:phosphoribosylanthranilate isomerase